MRLTSLGLVVIPSASLAFAWYYICDLSSLELIAGREHSYQLKTRQDKIAAKMSNQHDISMAISNPVENRSSPSEPAQHSARFTSLRIRVLNVETFIRLLPGSSLHNNSVMSVDEDIGIHNMPIQDLSMLS